MSLLTVFARRLRSFFRVAREDAETQDELRFHLEMETEKNLRAGMDSREARRQARDGWAASTPSAKRSGTRAGRGRSRICCAILATRSG